MVWFVVRGHGGDLGCVVIVFDFEIGFCVAQAGFELPILLPLPPKYWTYRHALCFTFYSET